MLPLKKISLARLALLVLSSFVLLTAAACSDAIETVVGVGYRFIGCSSSRKEEKQYAASYGQ
jgi:hypothetical protein